MRIIYLILIPILLFSQSSRQQFANYNFELNSDWFNWSGSPTFERSNEQAHNGTYSWKIIGDHGDGLYGSFLDNVNTGDEIYFGVWMYASDAAGEYRIQARNGGVGGTYVKTLTTGSWQNISDVLTLATDANYMIFINITGDTATFFVDDVFAYLKRDTLWVDANQADDTSIDTTKTLTEAFENRWVHTGGTFIVNGGIYNESITIDSSFAKLEGSGTITSIDFNSVTATVDLTNLTITTKLNDENITYLIADTGQDKGYKERTQRTTRTIRTRR